MNELVMKEMDQQVMAIVSDIESQISQLKQSLGGTGPAVKEPAAIIPPESDGVIKADAQDQSQLEDDPTADKSKKGVVAKDQLSTPGDTAAGQDSAEDRIADTLPETTEENVADVAKALVQALKSISEAKKAKTPEMSPVAKAFRGQSDAMQMLNEKIDIVAGALSNFLDGMGVNKQIEIAKEEQTKRLPVMNPDVDAVMKTLQAIAGVAKGSPVVEKSTVEGIVDNRSIVRKNLSDPQLFNFLNTYNNQAYEDFMKQGK